MPNNVTNKAFSLLIIQSLTPEDARLSVVVIITCVVPVIEVEWKFETCITHLLKYVKFPQPIRLIGSYLATSPEILYAGGSTAGTCSGPEKLLG